MESISRLALSSKNYSRCLSALLIAGSVTLSGCVSKILKADKSEEILKIHEFDNKIQVEALPPELAKPSSGTYVSLPGPEPVKTAEAPSTKKSSKKSAKENSKSKPVAGAAAPAAPVSTVHEPSLEDPTGFIGRRPKVDPFRVGEKVTYDVSYFNVNGGEMTLEVRPFVQVNGQRSYQFVGTALSTSVFAMFYAVDDWFETYVDYATLTPYSYSLHVKETKQLRETRTVFDWKKKTAYYWDKKIDAKKKVKEENKEWEIPSYSQNVFSAPYYFRTFTLKVGQSYQYRVAHEKQNLLVTVQVLRKEKITTKAGEFDAFVIKPKIELNGVFKPVGDIFMWLTDDDRKFIVRIESKIKIGTIVAEAKSIQPGL